MKPFREWFEERYGSINGQMMSLVYKEIEVWLNECQAQFKREVDEAIRLIKEGK